MLVGVGVDGCVADYYEKIQEPLLECCVEDVGSFDLVVVALF